MDNFIVDKQIKLEIIEAKHAELLYKIIDNNRPHLSRFLSWVDKMGTVDDLSAYIEHCEILQAEQKEISFVIFYNKLLVGRIGLHHINNQNKTGAIGYWLDQKAEGKGIITRACKYIIEYGFKIMALNRIEIKAAVDNAKSKAIPESLNFIKEGILREAEIVNGRYLDLTLYAILKTEWQTDLLR